MPPDTLWKHELLIQSITLFKSAGYFNFYWNPWFVFDVQWTENSLNKHWWADSSTSTASTKPRFKSHTNSVLLHSRKWPWTLSWFELHLTLSFVFKLQQADTWNEISFAPESCIIINQLHTTVCHNHFISQCFSFSHTHQVTLQENHLNFMLVTELQHCQNNSVAKSNVYFLSSCKWSFNSYISVGHLWKSLS